MVTALLNTVNNIGFEGLGIEPFSVNRVAFTVFGVDIYWYAVLITSGMLLAVLFACRFCKTVGLVSDDIMDALIWGLIPSLIGARLFYVLFSLDTYRNADGSLDFLEMINVRDGGLAIYGGVIVAFVSGLIICRVKKIDPLAMFDVAALGFMIGQTVGRWGNFMNAEAYGYETDLPWGMTINGNGPFHPTFLYESLWNLIGFVFLLLLAKFDKKRKGETFLEYFIWYGIGRAFIEGYRSDSLWVAGEGSLRISQALGIVFAFVGFALLIPLRLGAFDKFLDAREEKRALAREKAAAKKAEKQAAKAQKQEEKVAAEEAAYNPLFSDKGVMQMEDGAEEPRTETTEESQVETTEESQVETTEESQVETTEETQTEAVVEATVTEENNENA